MPGAYEGVCHLSGDRIRWLNRSGRRGLTSQVCLLHRFAVAGLATMYDRDRRLFVFRAFRETNHSMGTVRRHGHSPRYSAIVLIGMADCDTPTTLNILRNDAPAVVLDELSLCLADSECVGDVSLALWAAALHDHPTVPTLLHRLIALCSRPQPLPTVELSWALSALAAVTISGVADIGHTLAQRLTSSFCGKSAMFPHMVGPHARCALRSHVCCFADLVYPIQALARHYGVTGDADALCVAEATARRLCELQGRDGQWWWHYDIRTGDVVEEYPVYAVHQDAMAPMALFALKEVGGVDFSSCVAAGLNWLAYAPEIKGSLIDGERGYIWRKVGRRDPLKAVRRLRAGVRRLRPSSTMRCLSAAFKPGRVDFECRPYHLGWILHTWERSVRAIHETCDVGVS